MIIEGVGHFPRWKRRNNSSPLWLISWTRQNPLASAPRIAGECSRSDRNHQSTSDGAGVHHRPGSAPDPHCRRHSLSAQWARRWRGGSATTRSGNAPAQLQAKIQIRQPIRSHGTVLNATASAGPDSIGVLRPERPLWAGPKRTTVEGDWEHAQVRPPGTRSPFWGRRLQTWTPLHNGRTTELSSEGRVMPFRR